PVETTLTDETPVATSILPLALIFPERVTDNAEADVTLLVVSVKTHPMSTTSQLAPVIQYGRSALG
ncbi:hypothetical protein ACFRUF_004380, partial [Shigella flexneri]